MKDAARSVSRERPCWLDKASTFGVLYAVTQFYTCFRLPRLCPPAEKACAGEEIVTILGTKRRGCHDYTKTVNAERACPR